MKRFSKLVAALAFSLLSLSNLFAKDGIMAGEGKVQMVQTKWFDIIFGEEAKDSAAVMYANADQIYVDLAEMYGWKEPPCRMPVVLTTQVEVFNAYYSSGNYNHIVLYVTNPIADLSNQPDSLLWTFRHELTHAYTYNMKGKLTTAWTNVFGDSSTFHVLTVTPGVAEGATLTSESYEGNGRLNDEFTKHVVKQAKIEGKFPKYSDVQGSRDIYPKGSFYYFNGAFHEYLQKEYGLEKYAKFWYNCICNSLTTSGAFRKAYGLRLRKEWDKFQKQYKVPAVVSNPLKAGLAQDLFTPNSDTYSSENSKGALYSGLSQSEKGITYIDEYTSKVFFISKEDLNKDEIIPTYLFQYYYLDSAIQSLDGKYITVTYYDAKEENYRYHLAVYNTETKNWYKPEYHGVKEGIIVKQNSDYYLVALKFKGEKSAVKITKLILDDSGNIVGENEEVTSNFTRTQIASSFIPVKDGTFAYILNDSLNFSVKVMNVEGQKIDDFKVPDSENLNHFMMHYLSANNKNPDEIYFSWASEGTMPRVGKIDTSKGEFTLSLEDLSGGIFNPIKYDDNLIFVGNFYEYNRMFKKSSEFEMNDKYLAKTADFDETFASFNGNLPENEISSIDVDWDLKPYNPFKYLRGTFIPLSRLNSTSYDLQHRGSYSLPLGFTYMTNNPWDSFSYVLSAGYGFDTNSAAASFQISNENGSGTFGWETSLFSEFDYKGWKSGEITVGTTFKPQISNKTSLSINPSVFAHVGRSNATKIQILSYPELMFDDTTEITDLFNRIGMYGNHDDLFYLYASGNAIVSLNNLTRAYDNRFSYKGFYAGFVPAYYFSYDLTNSVIDYGYGDLTLFAECYIPRIISIDCNYGMTYNLPVKLFASAFSTSSVYTQLINVPAPSKSFPGPDLAMVAAEVLLYGQEIQKSVSFLPFLYFNDVYLSAIGCVGFGYQSHYTDSFGFLYTTDFVNEIITGQNKPMGVFAIKFATGLNFLNFGALARTAAKNYLSVIPTVIFPDFETEPTFKISWGLDIKF